LEADTTNARGYERKNSAQHGGTNVDVKETG
jgi:hypothetical protein